MRNEELKKTIGHMCEFRDKALEREFFTEDIAKAIKYMRPVVLMLGILNSLFIIPDYLLIKDAGPFRAVLVSRAVFLCLVVLLYFRIKHIKNSKILSNWITVYEAMTVLIFLLVFYQYESPDFLIQAFGVMLIILAVFLVPNRWINMIAVSFFTAAGFLILSLFYIRNLKTSEFSAGIVYIGIVIILSSISSFRINYYKRAQFINNRELIRLSVTDPLTGVFNRFKLDEEIHRNLNYSIRYDTSMSLVLFDFDDFKKINDTFGHLTGDGVIVDSINLINCALRRTDIFARWGGEEFVILLPGTGKEHALRLTNRIRKIIAGHHFDKVGKVTCSFGVVSFIGPEDTPESLIKRADKLLYSAKSKGKNMIMI